MAPKRQNLSAPLTTPEVRDALLELIRAKFYQGAHVQFAKDRRRLLEWVVFYPATWLARRGVTQGLPLARYKEIMSAVLIDNEEREREWQEMFECFLRDAAKHERKKIIESSGVFPRRN